MKISEHLLRQIERHGEVDFPFEACGLLIGTFDAIVDATPSRNLATSDHEFLIDPELHLRLQRELRGSGHKIIGVYHSHPSGDSGPSSEDISRANEPDFLWLITAIDAGRASKSQLFRHDWRESEQHHENFTEQPLQILKQVA